MNLIKQYIVQCISAAANNLRLTTEKMEVLALLREQILSSKNIESDIQKMKKITELSKIAIKLNEIFNYLSNSAIDVLKLSEKFKYHSSMLINDLSQMLEQVSPVSLKQILNRINEEYKKAPEESSNENLSSSIDIDLAKRKPDEKLFEPTPEEKIKEKLIFEDEPEEEDPFFHNYEETILAPVKPIDAMLKRMLQGGIEKTLLLKYSKLLYENGLKSEKIGFGIIANMHKIISKAFVLLYSGELIADKQIVEALRACLIVIVAVVRGKEVDITNYLNRAEEFGNRIQHYKIEENF